MLKQSFVYSVMVLMLVGCAATSGDHESAPVASIKPSQKVNVALHTVGKGQTLAQVAKLHGKSIERLASLNELQAPYTLSPGQKLILESKSSNSKSSSYNTAYAMNDDSLASSFTESNISNGTPQLASGSTIGFEKVNPQKQIYTDLPTEEGFEPSLAAKPATIANPNTSGSKQALLAKVSQSEFSQYESNEPVTKPEPKATLSSVPIYAPSQPPKTEVAAKEITSKPEPIKLASNTTQSTALLPATAPIAAISKETKDKEPKAKTNEKDSNESKALKEAKEAKDSKDAKETKETKIAVDKQTSKPASVATLPKAAPIASASGKKGWNWPHTGSVITEKNNYFVRNGIDIKGNRGDLIKSVAEGKVVYKGNALKGYGEMVIIKHSNDYLSAYAHNQKILVNEGDIVKAGETIAQMGSTDSDAVKLHFEMRHKGVAVDPMKYLPPR